jgi:hypothetical protein
VTFCEAEMAKLLFIQKPCENCGHLVVLNRIGIEAVYVVKGHSDRASTNREKSTPTIVFVICGKCECDTENSYKFTPEMMLDEAIQLRERAEEKGIEEEDAIISVRAISENPEAN